MRASSGCLTPDACPVEGPTLVAKDATRMGHPPITRAFVSDSLNAGRRGNGFLSLKKEDDNNKKQWRELLIADLLVTSHAPYVALV